MTSERTLFDRLLIAQAEIGKISKDKENPFFKSKYADINIVIDMIKPILNKEGILFMQPLSEVDGKPAITTILWSGEECIEYTTVFPELPRPAEGKKSNPFQEMGSAITYYRRYGLISILGLEAADDDATTAPQKETKKESSQPEQKSSDPSIVIPKCSICHEPMKPQAKDPTKFYCKHTEDDGKVRWGQPEY
ncbi:MAG: ERF family protein [Gammaproteobacteria bacterium]|nr:ERF family protein [Gammaproteobacteria bacterium]